ncbi:MAG TPA: hypothetical protein VN811_05340 [Thermoanaerobaculia bacterium]|nr:hypothetical protein [Thermoanaerobaculia bacterium]
MSPAADVAGSASRAAAVGVEPGSSDGAHSAAKPRSIGIASQIYAVLPAVAFAIGGVALAAWQPAEAGAETLYLTLVGGCVLVGAALLAGATSSVGASAATTAVGPLLAALVLWGMPAGPPRGIAFGVVLVASFVVATWRRLREGTLNGLAAVGGALALHALLRADELLPAVLLASNAAALARLLVPPMLAGLTLASLARRHPLGAVLAAGAAAALAARGFTVTGASPLLALAAVDASRVWRGRRRDASAASQGDVEDALRLRATLRDVDGIAAAGFGFALAAFGVVRPLAVVIAIAAAALVALPRAWVWIVAAAPLVYELATSGDAQRLFALAALVVLLPWAFLPRATPVGQLLGAVLVGAGGALLLPPPTGLAAAAAALALATGSTGIRGSLQRGWLAFLIAVGAIAAGYPWLRSQPLDVALGSLGLPAVSGSLQGLVSAVALLAAAALLMLAAARTSPRIASGLLAVGLAVGALVAMPPAARNVAQADGAVVRADAPVWSAGLDGTDVARVRVVSTLADSAELPAGTAIATLSLESEGRPLAAWTLRAGQDTAEWAAERPDLRGVAAAGPVWWSWLPPPGTFFAHAYASTWRLARPIPATDIRVARDPALPAGVTLSLLRVEVSR